MIWALFRALPLAGQLISVAVLAGSLLAAYGVWHHTVWMKGWKAHELAIARQDQKAVAATRAARDKLRDCTTRGMRWDQSTGECAGR